MSKKDYYPAGAYDDPEAPYNEKEIPELEFDVLCSQTLSKSVTCLTNDYILENEELGEDGIPKNIDTSETSWEDVYAENDYRTPLQLIGLFKRYLEYLLTGKENVPLAASFLKHLIKDCEEWTEDETVFY